jgi:hypothetical protein
MWLPGRVHRTIEETGKIGNSECRGEFKREGKDFFPEGHHLNLLYEFERYDFGRQFLVAGFSSNKATCPGFFSVRNPAILSLYGDFE